MLRLAQPAVAERKLPITRRLNEARSGWEIEMLSFMGETQKRLTTFYAAPREAFAFFPCLNGFSSGLPSCFVLPARVASFAGKSSTLTMDTGRRT